MLEINDKCKTITAQHPKNAKVAIQTLEGKPSLPKKVGKMA